MLSFLDRYLRGYLFVRLTGYSPERFLNLCKSNHILIWSLSPGENDSYEFYMQKRDFYRARGLLRKSRTSLRIREKHGLPFFLYRYRKRKLSFAAFLIALSLLYSLSFFIWDIEFEGNYSYSQESLLTFLQEEGVYHGILKNRIICDELEQKIRNQFPDITWVSAEISGTRLLVRLKENYGLLTVQEEDNTPSDLVAEKDGVILEIITRSGVPMVKAGDHVEKGQVLVSGAVPVENDSKEILSYQMVKSDADITAVTEEEVSFCSDAFLEVKEYTGRTKTGFFLCLGPLRFQLLGKGFSEISFDQIVSQGQLKLLDNFYLPIRYGTIKNREYISYSRNLSQEEGKEDAKNKEKALLKQYEEAGARILEQNLHYQWNGIQYFVTGTITLEEEIGVLQDAQNPLEQQDPPN